MLLASAALTAEYRSIDHISDNFNHDLKFETVIFWRKDIRLWIVWKLALLQMHGIFIVLGFDTRNM